MSEELDLTRGAALEAARVARGWSQNKLHKLSGISRKQIADAERGKNLTCDTLKILMRTLELKAITFEGDFTVHLPIQQGRIGVAAVLSASEEVDRIAGDVAARLRACSASLRRQTTAAEEDAELSEQATQLVRRFAQQVAKRTPDELDALSDMLMKSLSMKAAAPGSRQGKRRRVK